MRVPLRRCVLATIVLWCASPAHAHMGLEGFGSFANGAAHPVLVPAHMLLIVALALLAGRQGYARVSETARTFVIGLLAGLAIVSLPAFAHTVSEARLQQLILSGAMLAGLAVAAAANLPQSSWRPLVALAGCLIGLDSGVDGVSAWTVTQTYAGTAISTTVAILYLSSVAAEIHANRPHWMQIGLRIIGSWIAAIAILILALAFAGPSAARKSRSASISTTPIAISCPSTIWWSEFTQL